MTNAIQTLPPLSQSKEETTACGRGYVTIHIEGRTTGVSVASDRGDEVHDVMAQYVAYCAQHRLASDWNQFNKIAKAAKMEAAGILDGLRDRYEVPWASVYGTEMTLMLDEDFTPTHEISDEHWPKHIPTRNLMALPGAPGDYCAHIGTLDVVLISDDGLRGKIPDYKSGHAIFDADTYQGLLYSFMLLKHVPTMEVVTFELVFVRYQNSVRTVRYTRSDMPAMQQRLSQARERQKALHANPDEAQAIPCKQCAYCPLGALTLECPIKEKNPFISMNIVDRLIFKEWVRQVTPDNNAILRAHAEVHGSVSFMDGKGRMYEFGSLPVPSTRFPLDRTTLETFVQWKEQTGEDLLDGKLSISSTTIKPKLKAKKRAALLQTFEESIIETSTKPKWAIRTPDEGITEDYNRYTEEE